MKKVLITLIILLIAFSTAAAQNKLKVFISVDMEGLTGVSHWNECSRTGKDYNMFREIMTNETNAAVEGALAAGATEVIVRDSHGSARNILPLMLNKEAKLIRNWSGDFKMMMDGIDETFDAVIFVGYHAKAGTPDASLEHTMSGTVMDVSVNGVSLPEAGINALMAGHYNVPVVCVAGDKALCEHVKELFGEVETVAVKEGIGGATVGVHPEVACDMIRVGVERSLRNLDRYEPYKLNAPYTMKLVLKEETMVYEGQFYPGAERTGDWELTYSSRDIMEIVKAFVWMR
ncbi:MAG: M55 family metallopeptidase [Planctomycetes bacterium]|nr:M55 family metallopeptidase [Planctomycetota bacterium]